MCMCVHLFSEQSCLLLYYYYYDHHSEELLFNFVNSELISLLTSMKWKNKNAITFWLLFDFYETICNNLC